MTETLEDTDRVTAGRAPSVPSPTTDTHRLGPLLVLGSLGGVSALLTTIFWPGMIDLDTIGEIRDTSTGQFTDWHVPLLSALWRVPYRIGLLRSPGWLLFAGLLTMLVGLYLVLRVRFSRALSTLVAALCLLFPPVLTWALHVGVDQWFAAFLLCAFGFVARATRTTGGSRRFSLVAAVVCACVFDQARHNAVPATLVLFVVLAAVLLPTHLRHARLQACALGLLLTVGVVALESGLQWALGTQSVHPAQTLEIYDLAHLSKQEHRVLFPASITRYDRARAQSLIDRYAQDASTDTLAFSTHRLIAVPASGAEYAVLRHAWVAAVLHDPAGYLRERLRLGALLLSIGHPSYWLWDPPDAFSGYAPAFPGAEKVGIGYLSAFSLDHNQLYGDALYDVWIYAVVAAAGAVVLARRSRRGPGIGSAGDGVVAGLAVAALLYVALLVFAAPQASYRYPYPVVVVGTVVLPVLLPRRARTPVRLVHTPPVSTRAR